MFFERKKAFYKKLWRDFLFFKQKNAFYKQLDSSLTTSYPYTQKAVDLRIDCFLITLLFRFKKHLLFMFSNTSTFNIRRVLIDAHK